MKKTTRIALTTRTDVTPRRADTTNTGARPSSNMGRSQFASLTPRLASDSLQFGRRESNHEQGILNRAAFELGHAWDRTKEFGRALVGTPKRLLKTAALSTALYGCKPGDPGVTEIPTPIDMPTDPFSAGWPYETDKDLRDYVGVAMTKGGVLAERTEYPYEEGNFEDPQLISDLMNDWADNNVPSSLQETLLKRLSNPDFQEYCNNNPDFARILLGAYRDGVGDYNAFVNRKLDEAVSGNKAWTWNDMPFDWLNGSDELNEGVRATTLRNYNGALDNDGTLMSKNHFDGADPDNVFGTIVNEVWEYGYGDSPAPDIAQAIEGALSQLIRLRNVKDNSADADLSLIGVQTDNLIYSVGMNGYQSTPERELLMDGKVLLSPGARNSENNFYEEALLANYPGLNSSSAGSFNPGPDKLEDFEAIIGERPVNGLYDWAAFKQVGKAIEQFVDDTPEFQQRIKDELGPITPTS